MSDRVLVTGISGFLGGHVALKLLQNGYTVRGSVRKPDKAHQVRKTMAAHGADINRLEVATLDLENDAGWREAMADVTHVQHVASTFNLQTPTDKMELIRPAVTALPRGRAASPRPRQAQPRCSTPSRRRATMPSTSPSIGRAPTYPHQPARLAGRPHAPPD